MAHQQAPRQHRTWGQAVLNILTHPALFFRWFGAITVIILAICAAASESFRNTLGALIGIAFILAFAGFMIYQAIKPKKKS